MKDAMFVGLDVHEDNVVVAIAREDGGAALDLGVIPNTPVQSTASWDLPIVSSFATFCYEAGPCGYVLYRHIRQAGAECVVVAPSLVPQRPGDRVETDRRDARKLAGLLRSGELTPVWVPDEDHDALRDRVRGRKHVGEDLRRKRHQLGNSLLRLDLRPPEGVRPSSCRRTAAPRRR